MGKKYLNRNVRFQCGNGNAVWFSPQSGDSKVRINGSDALSDDCRIRLIGGSRPGQCNLVPDPATGAPGPCTAAVVSGTWNNTVRLTFAYQCLNGINHIDVVKQYFRGVSSNAEILKEMENVLGRLSRNNSIQDRQPEKKEPVRKMVVS